MFQCSGNEQVIEPTWAPNGKELLVTVLNKGKSRIMQFDLELNDLKEFPSKNNVKMGKWSYDGSMMYWYEEINENWQVIEKNIKTGVQRAVLNHPISRFETIGNNNLLYQKIGNLSVHLKDLEENTKRTPIEKQLLSSIDSSAWDAHPNTIFYTPRKSDLKNKMLYSMNFSTGESAELFPIEVINFVDAYRHLSVSSDGSIAFYTRTFQDKKKIVLMNSK